METLSITDKEFAQIRDFIYRKTGIAMGDSKKALVSGRLFKRLQHCGLRNFNEYFALITSGSFPKELQTAIDLLTTNETYFFREEKHFEFLKTQVLPAARRGGTYRVWSAACSSGEEPYSLAMLLADSLGGMEFDILASDISTRVLEKARRGLYPMERVERIPPEYLKRYCLRGTGEYDGMLLIEKQLRAKVRFEQVNLIAPMPDVGQFDLIFLRNVMIYFDMETKRQVVGQLLKALKPRGYFFIGHSESLMGVTDKLTMLRPSIYRHASAE
ncbi:chemotaxis protein methyltransferase CheR [Methylomagnum ishizawai]|uniref:Chemotaxis protein methyltransferase n=1 Tax=Methylomagnum ishizawai TaxID=1760988 RepID=A0A1Y6D2M3_9GAMM|nr:protein-glutamate O-methyltransferase [Methylomagnum ishizawai]SMF95113.1 chemotaxis protein methyltransferase CheR [Methylomagnum ishizawai]